ncbi:MAG: hypothetical protein EHM45_07225 [Desulfobacteraceae bacterium]|nr:MAG: hypothetical protein EHM45_07225 [Desulfobacteraceae bacterium]
MQRVRSVCFFTIVITFFWFFLSFGQALAASAYKDGMKKFKEKDYLSAEKLFVKAVQEEPKSKDAKVMLAWALIKQGRLKEAEKFITDAEILAPDGQDVIQAKAWSQLFKGDETNARKSFLKQVAWAEKHVKNSDFMSYASSDRAYIESMYSDGHYGLALLLKNKGDTAGAVQNLKTASLYMNDFMPRSQILTDLGDLCAQHGKPIEAAEAYEKAGQMVKPEADKARLALNKLGWIQFSLKNYLKSEEAFKKALNLKKDSMEDWYGLALSENAQNKQEAFESLKKTILLNPYYPETSAVYEIIDKKPEWRKLWKEWGIAYQKLGNYYAALFRLSGYLKEVQADDPEALTAAGWSCRWLGDLDSALANFGAAAKLKPAWDEPQVGLGSSYLAYAKLPEAKASFEKAVQLKKDNYEAYNGLAYYYSYQQDPVKALESLRKALSYKKDHYDSQAFLAQLLLSQKKYGEAAKEYKQLTELNPAALSPWNSLGWAYSLDGKPQDAAKAFEESIRLNPYLADAHYGLGLAYAKAGKKPEAKKELLTSIQIYPYYAHTPELAALIKENKDWWDLYAGLGWSYYYYLQYALAAPVFEEYLKNRKEDKEVQKALSWCKYWVGQLDEAYALFDDLLQKEKDDLDSLVGSGWVLFYKNKDEEALARLTRATTLKPDLADAWRTLSAIHFRKGRYAEAKAINQKIAELQPKAVDAYNNQGWALYQERKYNDALEKFNQSLQVNRYLGEPHYGLALCYVKLNNLEKARQEFLTAIYLYPAYMDNEEFHKILAEHAKLKDLHADLGWSYYNLFAYEAARFHFEKALGYDSKNISANLGLGTLEYVLGGFDKAVERFDKLLAQVPATAKAWDQWSYMLDNLAWSYYYLKEYDKAIAIFKRLEAYHPEIRYIAPLNGRGWAELQKGNKQEARRLFEESLKLLPGNYGADSGLTALKS